MESILFKLFVLILKVCYFYNIFSSKTYFFTSDFYLDYKKLVESRSKGLTHHWSFDHNLKDLVTNQSISIVGTIKFTEDRLGEKSKAVKFGSSYASVPEGNYIATSELTIVTWVKIYELKQWSRIFDFGNGQALNNFLLCLNSGYLEFYTFHVELKGFQIKKNLKLNTWIFISIKFKDSVVNACIDGLLIETYSFLLDTYGFHRASKLIKTHNFNTE